MLEGASDRGWACILPNFRGPNNRPETCASPAARRDILDAAAWAIDRDGIDPDRVYLAGSSGGGHMALVMAGEAPGVWAAVGASVPITDLTRWHAFHARDGETSRYARDLEAVCGGPPSAGRLESLAWDGCERDREYRRRSPLRLLHRAAGLPVRLEAGIRDGHAGSVPVDHSLLAFNALAIASARPEARLTHAPIEPDARRLLGDGVHLTAEAHWLVARLIDASLSRP